MKHAQTLEESFLAVLAVVRTFFDVLDKTKRIPKEFRAVAEVAEDAIKSVCAYPVLGTGAQHNGLRDLGFVDRAFSCGSFDGSPMAEADDAEHLKDERRKQADPTHQQFRAAIQRAVATAVGKRACVRAQKDRWPERMSASEALLALNYEVIDTARDILRAKKLPGLVLWRLAALCEYAEAVSDTTVAAGATDQQDLMNQAAALDRQANALVHELGGSAWIIHASGDAPWSERPHSLPECVAKRRKTGKMPEPEPQATRDTFEDTPDTRGHPRNCTCEQCEYEYEYGPFDEYDAALEMNAEYTLGRSKEETVAEAEKREETRTPWELGDDEPPPPTTGSPK